MLNFRRLKKDFSPSILDKGRDLYSGEMVQSATILAVSGETIRVSANIQGNFEHIHECEVEIDRTGSEMVDSNCDCSYQYDCQHLAALLWHLEGALDSLLVDFSKSSELDGEVKETVEEAKKKESEREEQKRQQEILKESVDSAFILGCSPLFVPEQELNVDRAEFAMIVDVGEIAKFQLALRLPLRSKPLYISNVREFVERIRYREPISISGRSYYFTLDSFSDGEREIAKRVLERARFINGEERYAYLESHDFGMILARAYELASERVDYDERPQPLPTLYLDTLEQPLLFAPGPVSLRVELEYLAAKIFLQPRIVFDGEAVPLDRVRLFDCRKPGLIYENVYHRFQSRVKRSHLCHLEEMAHMAIPESLFASLAEQGLPQLSRVADVMGLETIEQFPTIPFVGELCGECNIEYLDRELEAKLTFLYDNLRIPAASSDLTYDQVMAFVSDGKMIARNLVEEQELIHQIFNGFIYDPKEGTYLAKSEKKIVEFMTEIIPKFQDRISFECPETLKGRFLYDETEFEIHFSRGEEVDGYIAELKVNGDLKGVSLDRLWESIVASRTFIELKKGGKKKTLVLNLERLDPLVQLFDELGIKQLKNHCHKCPLWSLAHLDPANYKHLPIKMTLSDELQEIQQQMLGEIPVTSSPVPTTITGELRCYQKEGVRWLERLRKMHLSGILADDMGLGKTFQAIIALSQLHSKNQQSLIVCPTSLLYNWKEEFSKFSPNLTLQVVDGTPVQRQKLFEKSADCDILITSYSLLQKDIDLYQTKCFGYAILDEAQHIKNRGTRNAKSVKMIRAAHRLILTGTPVENSLDELWSLFDFLMPGLLSSYDRFVERHIRNTRPGQLEALSRKVAPFILRRMKCDVLKDLPPVTHITYHCHLFEKQKELYQAYATSAREELSRLVKREGFDRVQIHVLATLTRLKQICCHPGIFAKDEIEPGDSAKYDMLMELLHGLVDGGHKTVIFSQYTRMLKIMKGDLEKLGMRFCYLDGSTKNRLDVVKKFNEDPEIPVFLVSLKAGGTGLNLVGADTVIHYDMWWNPAVQNQATDRVHRLGQERSVSSYKLITKDTIEEKILELQKRKEILVAEIVSSQEGAVSKLTWDEVLELLQV